MIIVKKGNPLEDEADALVNTVNCVGVMGKGIALQFKQAYHEVFKEYEKACRLHEVQPGKMHVVESKSLFNETNSIVSYASVKSARIPSTFFDKWLNRSSIFC